MALDGIVVAPTAEHKATIVWLHGLGDSGEGFAPIARELKLPTELGVKYIFPHAPIQPVTINGGMALRSWYDIKSLELDKRADEQGVRESAALVNQIIQAELDAGIAADKIILAGFSQGGVVSLHLAPRLTQKIAGVMALSTYMCVPQKLADEQFQQLDIFMAHGLFDEVVPKEAGKMAHDVLVANGHTVGWHEYNMAHQVCMEEISAIREWLVTRLS
jgi:phospholipase/carboxylesterase